MEDKGLLPPQITRGLSDKLYEKRKIAALEVEKTVREAVVLKDHQKISNLIDALINEYSYSTQSNSRNGGLIALAAAAIALGPLVHLHLKAIVPPIIASFADHDSRVRYYACESAYNVAKVARAAILTWFNEIFDALTKLSVDVEISVKNGAELLDRLIKDIVSEKSTYFNPDIDTVNPASQKETDEHPLSESPTNIFPPVPGTTNLEGGITSSMFNLPRFIPLLTERIHVINAPGRLFLVQWINVLNSVPDLELLTYLPVLLN